MHTCHYEPNYGNYVWKNTDTTYLPVDSNYPYSIYTTTTTSNPVYSNPNIINTPLDYNQEYHNYYNPIIKHIQPPQPLDSGDNNYWIKQPIENPYAIPFITNPATYNWGPIDLAAIFKIPHADIEKEQEILCEYLIQNKIRKEIEIMEEMRKEIIKEMSNAINALEP